MHDCRLAGMMVMLLHVVHRVVCRGSHLVHSYNGAVTDGAAIVPYHVRADGDRFEGISSRWHASMLLLLKTKYRGNRIGDCARTERRHCRLASVAARIPPP